MCSESPQVRQYTNSPGNHLSIGFSGLKYGMSLHFAADTSLGPLYFAYGRGSGSNALYLFLGRP